MGTGLWEAMVGALLELLKELWRRGSQGQAYSASWRQGAINIEEADGALQWSVFQRENRGGHC
jgi:hypothetical protein